MKSLSILLIGLLVLTAGIATSHCPALVEAALTLTNDPVDRADRPVDVSPETHARRNKLREQKRAIERRDPIALRIAIEADIRDGFGHLGKAELLGSYTESSAVA